MHAKIGRGSVRPVVRSGRGPFMRCLYEVGVMSKLKEFLTSAAEMAVATVKTARDISNSPHMAPIHAMIRQGADEIAQVLPAFPAQGIQPVAEMGQLFEITPGMATEQIKGQKDRDLEMEM
jgi:hypothetical protein